MIGTCDERPLAVSSVQTSKSRSNAIVLPSMEIVGHNTRPSANFVICRGWLPGTTVQMFW